MYAWYEIDSFLDDAGHSGNKQGLCRWPTLGSCVPSSVQEVLQAWYAAPTTSCSYVLQASTSVLHLIAALHSPCRQRRIEVRSMLHTSSQGALLLKGPPQSLAASRDKLTVRPCRLRSAIHGQQRTGDGFQLGVGRSVAAKATSAAESYHIEDKLHRRLRRLSQSVLVGLAGAACWSISASAFSTAASSGPLASFSLAAAGASSAGE